MNAEIVSKLVRAGMRESAAREKATLFQAAESALATGSGQLLRCYVPGRIEILGKHTDYAGGRSLLCAAERGICVAACARNDVTIHITDEVRHVETASPLAPDLELPSVGWTVYPKTVARRIARNFAPPLRGADIAIASDLPAAAGMSSSSALVVAIWSVLSGVNQLSERDEYRGAIQSTEELAEYLGCIENGQSYRSLVGDRGVGTFGGSEDHTAILTARPGSLIQYSFCPVHFECAINLPSGYMFVIGSSGVVADKIGSAREKYNKASNTAKAVLAAWNCRSGVICTSLAAALSSSPEAPEAIRKILRDPGFSAFDSDSLLRRFEQFSLESEIIVPQASAALSRGDVLRFGNLVDQSQQAAEELLANQVPETIALARSARNLGAAAASAFGAGFGGSVWALVRADDAEAFSNAWAACYHEQFPAASQTQFFVTAPGPPLRFI